MYNDQEPVPPGFVLIPSGPDTFVIHYKRTGMGCLNLFVVAWLVGWTFFCVLLLHQFLNGGTMENGDSIPLWFVLIFWGVEIGVACLLAFLLFSKRIFRVDPFALAIETNVLGYRRYKEIPRDSIERFVQVKDGGEDDDSFPSWGLKVEGDEKVTLISRQPYEKSHWLGQFLAQWADVEFVKAYKS